MLLLSDILNEEEINLIIKDLQEHNYNKIYYIQEFRVTEENIGNLQQPTSHFDKSRLLESIKIVWR